MEGRARSGGLDPSPSVRRGWALLPLNRVPIWTLLGRIRDLDRLRAGLQEYFGVVRHEAFPYRVVETPHAQAVLADLEELLPRCRQIVAVGGVPSAVRLVAGEEAGETSRVNIVSVAFELDRHNLRREDLLAVLEAAGAHHRTATPAAWLRTVNPLFWLDMTLSVAEVLPFLPLRWLGRDPGRAAASAPGSALRMVFRLVALAFLIWLPLRWYGLDGPVRDLGEEIFRRMSHLGRGLSGP